LKIIFAHEYNTKQPLKANILYSTQSQFNLNLIEPPEAALKI